MPNIQKILVQIFEELGLAQARHAELIEKFEILTSKLFLTLLFDQHFETNEAELVMINFELSKKNDSDYMEYLDSLLPLSVIDYYLFIASVVVLKQYLETLMEKGFLSKDKIKELLK